MAKRIKYEAGGNEEEYVFKCMKCIHSYTRMDESDTLMCSLKKCRFQEQKIKSNDMEKMDGKKVEEWLMKRS